MPEDKLLAVLQDRQALLEAYAASSARVMRGVFERHKVLKPFRGRRDLAPAILERLKGIHPPGDPVIIGAHLYALELTGARPEMARGVTFVLRAQGKKDPYLVGQLAGFTGAALLRPEGRGRGMSPTVGAAGVLRPPDLAEILKAAEREGGES